MVGSSMKALSNYIPPIIMEVLVGVVYYINGRCGLLHCSRMALLMNFAQELRVLLRGFPLCMSSRHNYLLGDVVTDCQTSTHANVTIQPN